MHVLCNNYINTGTFDGNFLKWNETFRKCICFNVKVALNMPLIMLKFYKSLNFDHIYVKRDFSSLWIPWEKLSCEAGSADRGDGSGGVLTSRNHNLTDVALVLKCLLALEHSC